MKEIHMKASMSKPFRTAHTNLLARRFPISVAVCSGLLLLKVQATPCQPYTQCSGIYVIYLGLEQSKVEVEFI